MTCTRCRYFDRVPGDTRGFCVNPALDNLVLMASTLCIEEDFGCIFWTELLSQNDQGVQGGDL